jgi:hypothetical protein
MARTPAKNRTADDAARLGMPKLAARRRAADRKTPTYDVMRADGRMVKVTVPDDEPRMVNAQESAEGVLQVMNVATLVALAHGTINLNLLGRLELASRGLDRDGQWIGFDAARQEAEGDLLKNGVASHATILQARAKGGR